MLYVRANNPREVIRQSRTFERDFAITERATRLLPISPGDRVLDLSCGAGDYTRYLARAFPKCEVVGWDGDELLVNAASARARREKSRARFEVRRWFSRVGQQTFDHVVMREVLLSAPNPVRLIRWAAGLCRPGGSLSALDCDYGASLFFPPLEGWTEFLAKYARWAARYGEDFDCGRKLVSHFVKAGLPDVNVAALTDAEHAGDREALVASVETEILSMDVDREKLVHESEISESEYDRIVRGMRRFARQRGAYVQHTSVFVCASVG